MAEANMWFWWLVCIHGDSLWIEGPESTPPVDLASVRCPYHDVLMQIVAPVEVKE